MHRQRFFQTFLQAPRSARIDPFQLPEDFLQRLFGLHVVVHRIGIAHPPIVIFLAVLRQILPYIPSLVNLATLHFHLVPENTFHTGSQRFRSVDHHQIPPLPIQSAVHQIFQQPFDHRSVLRGSLPHSQNVLFSAFGDPQSHHQHLAAKVNANRSSAPPDSGLLGVVRTAPATGCYWRPQTAGSRCSSRSRSLPEHSPPLADSSVWTVRPPYVPAPLVQFSVLLQLTVALQFHFLTFARSDPRSFQRNLLSSKDHITRLLPPAHTAGAGIRSMRGPYPMRYFVFQDGAQDLQPGLPGQLFHLRLHLRPHSAIGNGTRTSNSCPPTTRTCDWTCGLSSGISFSRRLSPLKRDSQPELYPSSGESRCFLFSSFN